MRVFSTPDARGRRGFTIVELAAVLVVLTLVSTFAIRSWFARGEVTLQNAANLLAEDLRHMQAHASLEHAPLEVVFHPDGGGYHARLVVGADARWNLRRYPVDAVFEDVQIDAVRIEQGEHLIFDARGHASRDAWITLVQRGLTRTVSIDAAHNRITVEGGRR